MESLNKLQGLLFAALDPNSDYTMEDFNKECSEVKMNTPKIGIDVSFVNDSDNPDPEFETDGSAGFDLRANLSEPITIDPMKRTMVPTGLYFDLPLNFELQVRPRSGLAYKKGVTVLNTPGTVDSDYTGEVKVILINLGDESFTIEHGERIAQGVIDSKPIINLSKINKITKETDRGSGGFGSTGTK